MLDGTLVRARVVFYNTSGAVDDPPGVTVTWDGPDALSEVYTYGVDAEVVKESVGNYYMERPMTGSTEIGQWWVRWNGTPAFVATEDYFYVKDGHL